MTVGSCGVYCRVARDSSFLILTFIPRGIPLRGLRTRVGKNGENRDFLPINRYISKTTEDRHIKHKDLDTCYSATYTSQTRDQQRFTISEVAADWHKPMVPQRIMWPSIPALTDNWTHGAASRHTIAPISHTRPSPRSRSYYSFPVPLRVGD